MSFESAPCEPSVTSISAREREYGLRESVDLPFSASFPAFTAINRRRRVTCKSCDLPIGYVDIGMTELEAVRCKDDRQCSSPSDTSNLNSISIKCPINVSLASSRSGSCDAADSGNAHMTWIMEDAEKNAFDADEIICDGCGSTLGARITAFEAIPSPEKMQDCETTFPEREERCHWYSFSLNCVKVEAFFGIVGMRELASWYHGGERFFHDFQAIEDSDRFSNDSRTWMRPHERLEQNESLEKEAVNERWSFPLTDLVRASELPEGTLGHVSGPTMAYVDNLDAFSPDFGEAAVGDDSVLTPRECCSEMDLAETVLQGDQ